MSKDRAYPLHWPDEWPRTQPAARGSAQFRSTLSAALKNVEDSLRRFASDSNRKVENVMISSNVSLANSAPEDPGVAVYFSWDGISTCVAVDRYKKVEHNLQAIHHVLEAERTKLRHGGLNLVRAGFRGYAALPPPSAAHAGDPPWHEVLDVPANANPEAVRKSYQRLRSKYHPDRGGDAQDFYRLNRALDAFERSAGLR